MRPAKPSTFPGSIDARMPCSESPSSPRHPASSLGHPIFSHRRSLHHADKPPNLPKLTQPACNGRLAAQGHSSPGHRIAPATTRAGESHAALTWAPPSPGQAIAENFRLTRHHQSVLPVTTDDVTKRGPSRRPTASTCIDTEYSPLKKSVPLVNLKGHRHEEDQNADKITTALSPWEWRARMVGDQARRPRSDLPVGREDQESSRRSRLQFMSLAHGVQRRHAGIRARP